MGKYVSKREAFELELAQTVVPTLQKMGFSNITIRSAYPGLILPRPHITITFNEISHAPKGISVKTCIDYVKDIDNADYIIYIDGSGKIDKKYILDIANVLINNNVDAVLSERGKNKAISEDRWKIEKFELFLLEEKYNKKEFPDGQCGLWGFKVHKNSEKTINITIYDYGVELNLLAELIKKNCDFEFVQIEVSNPEGITNFKDLEHTIKKLRFLSETELIKGHHIIASLHKFSKERMKLPDWYIQEVEKNFNN